MDEEDRKKMVSKETPSLTYTLKYFKTLKIRDVAG